LLLDATNQMSEKKLFRRQIERRAGTNSFVSLQVDLQIVGAQTIFVCRGSARSSERSREQLRKRIPLNQIIIRAQFKSLSLDRAHCRGQ
jgi:hypothetical protein